MQWDMVNCVVVASTSVAKFIKVIPAAPRSTEKFSPRTPRDAFTQGSILPATRLRHQRMRSTKIVTRRGCPAASLLCRADPYRWVAHARSRSSGTGSPTAAHYLGQVTKAVIVEAVREGVTEQAVKQLADLKKPAMAEAAERLPTDKGWLPKVLRFPQIENREALAA